MDNDRNYILERLKSKHMTQEEFNFDHLQAPPLSALLSPWDIEELYSIASSIKYSAKPEVRYDAIDKVMKRRGFIKLGAGTNRVVYRHPEDTSFVLKIASDDIGLGDNPAEYRNQFILKPFVTKCFEIDPSGVVGVFERVNPITSREEFLSVAEDIFELINEWLIGEYVLADIGSNFFMNYGRRDGFGPVILDYPYMYPLDGNKLYCKAPNKLSPTGTCDGIIDYDDGYNFLHCTKCGVKYKAKELRKKIKSNEIQTIREKGEINMKIKVSGGSLNLPETIIDNSVIETVKSTPVIKKSVKNTTKKEEVVIDTDKDLKKKKSVNGASKNSKITESPVTFTDKDEPSSNKNNKSSVEIIEDALKTISNEIKEIKIKVVKDDIISRIFDTVFAIGSSYTDEEYYINILRNELARIGYVNDDGKVSFDDKIAIVKEELEDEKTSNKNLSIALADLEKKFDKLKSEKEDLEAKYAEVDQDSIDSLNNRLEELEDENYSLQAKLNELSSNTEVDDADDNTEDNVEIEPNKMYYHGMKFYDARIIDIVDLFADQESRGIIVMLDEDDNMVTDSNNDIYAIDVVDDRDLSETTLVSKKWLKDSQFELESLRSESEETETDNSEESNEQDDIAEDNMSPVRSDMFTATTDETTAKFIEEIEAAENNTEE